MLRHSCDQAVTVNSLAGYIDRIDDTTKIGLLYKSSSDTTDRPNACFVITLSQLLRRLFCVWLFNPYCDHFVITLIVNSFVSDVPKCI